MTPVSSDSKKKKKKKKKRKKRSLDEAAISEANKLADSLNVALYDPSQGTAQEGSLKRRRKKTRQDVEESQGVVNADAVNDRAVESPSKEQ